NKYPGVTTSVLQHLLKNEKLHMAIAGYGYHDLLVTSDHEKNFPDMPVKMVEEVFQSLRKRYLQVSNDERIDYISMFQNWGASAGASLYHPHMQIIALPILPAHISHELIYSLRYFEKNGSCLYCDLILEERRQKKRVIFEN